MYDQILQLLLMNHPAPAQRTRKAEQQFYERTGGDLLFGFPRLLRRLSRDSRA